MKNLTATIIGTGRLGMALTKALNEAGYFVANSYGKGESITVLGDLTFIATPDSEIGKIVSELALNFENLDGKFVFHSSGTISSSILGELRKRGAKTACFHPLQAITQRTTSFKDIYFDIEGMEDAVSMLEEMVESLEAKSIRVTPEEKQLLHISAVMASNYLVTLADMAVQISGASSISERTLIDALLPLMESSLDNLRELRPSEALTGPIARGDVQTIQKHIKLLENEAELLEMYKKLGLQTLELIGKDLKDNTIKFRLYDVLK
ncbi:MAG: Rossmann-like and DUF2520 domain-containing protein [Balneolaceae bacterium]